MDESGLDDRSRRPSGNDWLQRDMKSALPPYAHAPVLSLSNLRPPGFYGSETELAEWLTGAELLWLLLRTCLCTGWRKLAKVEKGTVNTAVPH